MDIGCIIMAIYLIVGIILCLYWFDRDYSKQYDELVKNDIPDKGMASMFLLMLWVFWPINLIKNIIKYNKI